MKTIKSALLALAAFNLLIFFAACVEYAIGMDKCLWPAPDTFQNQKNSDKPTVIMFHGFGGSPYDFRKLAKEVSAKGYPVKTPVTPYQNQDYFAHGRGAFSHKDYVQWAEKIISDEHQKTGKKPIVIGFSMGGALSILSARKAPVKKLILLAPYLNLSTLPSLAKPMAFISRIIIPVVPKIARGQIYSDKGYSAYRPGSYLVSLSAFYRLEQMKSRAQADFKNLKLPVLMIASTNDKVSNYQTSRKACSQLKNCSFVRLNISNHIILFDNDADYVIDRVIRFLQSAPVPAQQDE